MRKETAAKIIESYEVNGCGYCHQGGPEVEEAFRMAADALKNPARPCKVRLIDADKVISLWDKYHYSIATHAMEFDEELRKSPAVDAIPIEWLKEHYPTKQVYGTEQYFRTAYAVQDILAEWERTRKEK